METTAVTEFSKTSVMISKGSDIEGGMKEVLYIFISLWVQYLFNLINEGKEKGNQPISCGEKDSRGGRQFGYPEKDNWSETL